MGSQQFCLKWNNHQANMLTVFEHLLSNEALVDVTLACEGSSLKAHKMVLSACSPFFQSLFLENPCKHPIVIMKDMRYTDLKAIIDFMYRGEVNVSQDQLSALLKTAETLKVKGLAEVTGENKQGPNSLVKEELVKNSTSTPTPTQNRAESPPLSRRKRGRPRRRSLSGSNRSDSEEVPSKIKEPDSPEVIEDMSRDGVSEPMEVHSRLNTNHTPSQVSSHLPSVHSSIKSLPSVLPQTETHMNIEEPPSGDEGDFDVEPSKLMEQTLTTDNMVYPDGPNASTLPNVSSQLTIPSSDSQSHHTNQGSSIENQALVPCSMPSDPSTSSHITDDSSQDIKPHNLVSYEEPPMSPIAGTSHQDNSNSSMMMYMDTSGVPAIPGPSNYQLDKQSPSQQQPQGKLRLLLYGELN
ncbi:hypothetical protein LAZ67_1001204, partial [Cordylochernes scorpioides]